MHQNEIFEIALSHQTNKLNINLALRARSRPRECERNESVAEGQSGHTFMLCFTSLRQTRDRTGTTSPAADGDPN